MYNKSLTINNSSGVSLFYHCFYPLSTAYQTIVPFFKYNYHNFFQINRLRSTSARCVNNSISSLFLFPTGSYCLLLTPTVSRAFRRLVAIHTVGDDLELALSRGSGTRQDARSTKSKKIIMVSV